MRCRNRIDDVKTRRLQFFGDRIQKLPVYCLDDIRHIDDVICSEAFIRNIGTCRSAVKGNVQMGNQKSKSTDVGHRDGLTGSSVEAVVMMVERSGRHTCKLS